MGFRVTEKIDRPIEEVWSTMTNWGQASLWMETGNLDIVGGGDEVGQGTRLSFESRGQQRETEITRWEPHHHVALQSTQGGMTALYNYSLEPHEGATEVTLEAQCWGTGLLWKMAAPLIGVAMKRADSGQLAALKLAVER